MTEILIISAVLIIAIIALRKFRKNKTKYPQYHLGEMTAKDVPAEMKKNYVGRKKQYINRKFNSPGYPS
jgi:hypothetical protein